jgi:hypothetical protein
MAIVTLARGLISPAPDFSTFTQAGLTVPFPRCERVRALLCESSEKRKAHNDGMPTVWPSQSIRCQIL